MEAGQHGERSHTATGTALHPRLVSQGSVERTHALGLALQHDMQRATLHAQGEEMSGCV